MSGPLQVKLIVQPRTIKLLKVGPRSGGGGSTFQIKYHTITSGEATAKAITLSPPPADPTQVSFDVQGCGSPQFVGDDFNVSGSTLTWALLGLDGLMPVGTKVKLMYNA